MVLATERLLLRPIEPTDVPDLVTLWTNPEVTRYLGGPRSVDFLVKTFEADLRNHAPSVFDQWPVVEKVTNRIVGYCGLLRKKIGESTEIELVYAFNCSVWGNGYATEIAHGLKQHAFDRLGLPRLVSLIDPENLPSRRVATSVGMHFEKEIIRPGGKKMHLYLVSANNHHQ